MFIKREFWIYYMMGRSEKRLLKTDTTEDDLVTAILAPDAEPLRDVLLEVCRNAAKPLETGKTKRKWLEDHREEIGSDDPEEAYKAWLHGRVDELAYALEGDVITALGLEVEGSEGGDEETETDGEEEGGDEDEDEDDEDESDEDDDEVPPRRDLGTRR